MKPLTVQDVRTEIKLWDAQTGGCVATFTGHSGAVRSVAFAPDSSCLYTDTGTIPLSAPLAGSATALPASPHPLHIQGYGVSADKAWITQDGCNLLWLPPEYRSTTSTVAGLMVAVGCASRRVLLFRFSEEADLLS